MVKDITLKDLNPNALTHTQFEYYKKRKDTFERGGTCGHDVWSEVYCFNLTNEKLKFDSPVVCLANNSDGYLVEVFRNSEELASFIKKLKDEAAKVWGTEL